MFTCGYVSLQMVKQMLPLLAGMHNYLLFKGENDIPLTMMLFSDETNPGIFQQRVRIFRLDFNGFFVS